MASLDTCTSFSDSQKALGPYASFLKAKALAPNLAQFKPLPATFVAFVLAGAEWVETTSLMAAMEKAISKSNGRGL